jgi:hypothetical protein
MGFSVGADYAKMIHQQKPLSACPASGLVIIMESLYAGFDPGLSRVDSKFQFFMKLMEKSS